MKIIATPLLVVQFRFPRSRRCRIRRKWSNAVKRPGNFRPDPNCYVSGDTILCHPQTRALLEAADKRMQNMTCSFGSIQA